MADPINCFNCGASIDLKDPARAKMVRCSYCGSYIDLLKQTAEKPRSGAGNVTAPKSALKLGLEGNINGILYQIVGRIRYRDLKSFYWWDEWLLLSSTGQYKWLVEDDWDFTLTHKYTPTQPFDPNTVRDYMNIDGQRLEVEDNSSAAVLFFEGELTWKAEIGDRHNYVDAWKGEHTVYSCNWTENEITYYIGKDILADKIYQAFNLGTPPPEAYEPNDDEKSPFQKFVSKLLGGPLFKYSLLFGLLYIMAAVLTGFFGTKVESQAGYNIGKEGNSFIYGPYKLAMQDRVHKVNTRMKVPNNSSVYCIIEVIDEKREALLDWDNDFWFESGRDSDGYWEESNQNKTAHFVLREKGDYYLKITPDPPFQELPKLMRITVTAGTFDPTPLWISAFITMIYPGIVLVLFIFSNSSSDDDD